MADGQVLDEDTEFEQHRRYLSAVAYRLLGSLADAEDAVQDAWLRWRAVDRSTVQDARAFLTTVVTRICYDLLGSARVRREAYYGEWLPEPSIGAGDGVDHSQSPEDAATLGESVSYAMLAVMEQLTPAERAAFVLHDVFAVEFDEIAEALGRTPEATRQLASRARRRMREREQGGPRKVDRAEHRKVVAAFAAATVNGDIPGLMAVLDPNVVWHADGGGIVRAVSQPVVSAERVARLVGGLVDRWFGPDARMNLEQAEVNGAPGLVALDESGAAMGVLAFAVENGRITEAFVVVNPEKLVRVAGGMISPHLPRR
jgi:RNA polymerase sigma-70 factor (ECF subfamily)